MVLKVTMDDDDDLLDLLLLQLIGDEMAADEDGDYEFYDLEEQEIELDDPLLYRTVDVVECDGDYVVRVSHGSAAYILDAPQGAPN